jgi:hypothetical protein
MVYANMALVEATVQRPRAGGAQSPRSAGGLFTRAKNFTATVYVTLNNASTNSAKVVKPKFARRNALWFLARQPAQARRLRAAESAEANWSRE